MKKKKKAPLGLPVEGPDVCLHLVFPDLFDFAGRCFNRFTSGLRLFPSALLK
ncbi:unnamed protein product [Rodentolepis nana]|uniref:Uncharacterized protein n=1 Tax=Rodentolepis nana TaxID=102285 RepID=A0A0R3TJ48_RODNA|nr:unnamed protein product [Rodentolepis nana]